MSKKYATGGRFDPSLTQLNVKTGEEVGQIGAKMGQNRGSSLAFSLIQLPKTDNKMETMNDVPPLVL